MKKVSGHVRTSRNAAFERILGLSEAIGTVLLLGISVMLAGTVWLWTSQIDEGEEGVYVDLWASVQGTDLVIMHRGGDFLDGKNTEIIIRSDIGIEIDSFMYYEFGADESWGPGEEVTIDISGAAFTNEFTVIVTSIKDNGEPITVLSSELLKNPSAGSLPDLAISQILIIQEVTTMVNGVETVTRVFKTTIYEIGDYIISVKVTNYGVAMTEQYFQPEGSMDTLTNLRIFDTEAKLESSGLTVLDNANVEIPSKTPPALGNGESFTAEFTWSTLSSNPRSLGLHVLNVKIIPYPGGEVNYRNNYVERKLKVDKELLPVVISGPDPGVYDIYFSNEAPKSGELVTVTVIVQNSGDREITSDMGVHLIVSTWVPLMKTGISTQAYDWRMDYEDYYGEWRTDNVNDPSLPLLVDDDSFPTCIKTNLALLPGAYLFLYFTLEAKVDKPGGEQWVYAAIDVYTRADRPNGAISSGEGDEIGEDNIQFGHIQVLPKILVVDDDENPSGTEGDMTAYVLESLVGAGVNIDKLFIAQQLEYMDRIYDTPAFNYPTEGVPSPALEDYDVVIWVTGGIEDPFTNVQPTAGPPAHHGGNIQHLINFMNANKYLLIVGTSPFTGLGANFVSGDTQTLVSPTDLNAVDASLFMYEYLGISIIQIDEDLPLDEPLIGVDDDKITPWEINQFPPPEFIPYSYEIQLNEQTIGNKWMQFYQLREGEVTDGVRIFEEPVPVLTRNDQLPPTDPPMYNSLRTTSKPDLETEAQYRAVVLGWNITQIRYLNEKIDLFANILSWFDWNINVGRDMAVTKMELAILTQNPDGSWGSTLIDETNVPKYLDTIELTVTVRNNGPTMESSSAIFYVTGPEVGEVPIANRIPDPSDPDGGVEEYSNPTDITLSGRGGETTIKKLWLAVGVGAYSFRVVVDPYHLISEINEDNNDISYSTSTVSSFVTQNNILIVDDDFSSDNFDVLAPTGMTIDYSSSGGEPSDVIDKAVHTFGYDYEVRTVINGYSTDGTSDFWDFDSGLSILDLKRYNAVIWVFGDSGNQDVTLRETLTDGDIFAIRDYLEGNYPESDYLTDVHHENIMFVGSEFVRELASDADDDVIEPVPSPLVPRQMKMSFFLNEYLGIQATIPTDIGATSGVEGPVDGSYFDDIYLGLDYSGPDLALPSADFASIEIYSKAPVSGTVFRSAPGLMTSENDDLIANQLQYTKPKVVVDEGRKFVNFRTVVHSWDLTALARDLPETPLIIEEASLSEVLYLTLHWFATPEDSPELLGRDCRIYMESDNPVIGNAYLIQVKIANIGGTPGGGTVRFNDGTTLIKSENVYLENDTVATLEALWRPIYAGSRVISVEIDKYDDTDEVFDEINNVPTTISYVYFFWDDMESGDRNWNHDSTVLLINGEGTLDYMKNPTDTKIDDTWDTTTIAGFQRNLDVVNENIEKEYHSSDVSYFMHEPSGAVTKAVDVVFAIDSSTELGEGPLGLKTDLDEHRKSATRYFIDQFYDEYRVGIVDFNDQVVPFKPTYALSYDKTSAKSSIALIDSTGTRPLWDAGYHGLYQLDVNGRDDASAIKVLIIVSGGAGVAASYNAGTYAAYRDLLDNNPDTEDQIFVYTINLVNGNEAELKAMCTQSATGGPYYYKATTPSQLTTIYENIKAQLRSLSISGTRGDSDEIGGTRGDILFEDSFPTNALDLAKWDTTTPPLNPLPSVVTKEPYSASYSLEFEGTDVLISKSMDLRSLESAYIEFYWRAGYRTGTTGPLENGDYIWLDIHTQTSGIGKWTTSFYRINGDSMYSSWNRERVQIPSDALWSGFQFKFSGAMSSIFVADDAFYIDDVRIETGLVGPGSMLSLDLNPWSDGTTVTMDKSIQTNVIDLSNVDGANLSFYQKYNMKKGENGGYIEIGYLDGGVWKFEYIQPKQPYTGDFPDGEYPVDDFGNNIRYCWNGISGSGTLEWEYVSVDLTGFLENEMIPIDEIIIRFCYHYVSGGTGYGWIIDDVKVTVNSDDNNLDKDLTADNWRLKNLTTEGDEAYSGHHAWFCGDSSTTTPLFNTGDLKAGIDNSLYSRPIDLTNARTATLQAYFRFNIDTSSGRPPDGFRIEVSTDNGVIWTPINLGVRAAWGVSGSELDSGDGVIDGRSYTGIVDDPSKPDWVPASSLTRLIPSLNAFTGNVIILRFRVVTNDLDEQQYSMDAYPLGFYVDDVMIFGESLSGSRAISEDEPSPSILSDLGADDEFDIPSVVEISEAPPSEIGSGGEDQRGSEEVLDQAVVPAKGPTQATGTVQAETSGNVPGVIIFVFVMVAVGLLLLVPLLWSFHRKTATRSGPNAHNGR